MSSNESDKYQILRRLRSAEGERAYHLDCFGDYLAKREGYKSHDGLDAVHFYLVQKYRWTPAQVKALNGEDLNFLLAEEMEGWTLPPKARRAAPTSATE